MDEKSKPGSVDEMLEWVDERFLKSFARVHCLALISRGHEHGYDIMKHIETSYGVKVSAGQYYPILQELEDSGYISGEWEHVEGKPGKKMYKITPSGMKLLQKAKERMVYLMGEALGSGRKG